ncbi:hypothetical protein D3C80_1782260 [compost metagenome]
MNLNQASGNQPISLPQVQITGLTGITMNGKCSSPITAVALIAIDLNPRLRSFGQANHLLESFLSIVYVHFQRQES